MPLSACAGDVHLCLALLLHPSFDPTSELASELMEVAVLHTADRPRVVLSLLLAGVSPPLQQPVPGRWVVLFMYNIHS
jgi:hypothetical protein